MSRRRDCCCNGNGAGNGLLILILIVLQFNCRERHEHEHEGCIDNGILFIIALFFLACCGNFNLCCNNGY